MEILTPKRKIYYFKRKVNKHQDLLLVLVGISAIIFFIIYKIKFA